MLPKLLALFWLFLLPVLSADPALGSLFVIKKGTDAAGGCASRYKSLESSLTDARTLVQAGLQAIKDARNPSAKESKIAKRYLYTYFRAKDEASIAYVENFMAKVKSFLDGNWAKETPYLFCNDEWLKKLERTDAAWDTDKQETVMEEGPDGVLAPITVENVGDYQPDLWEQSTKGLWSRNKNIPYWSDDLKEYVFDEDYDGKTFCTHSEENLGLTQDVTIPATVTLCPNAFTNPKAVVSLGSETPKVGLSIANVLPRSGTFYHELYHLAVGMIDTPDMEPGGYDWAESQRLLKKSPKTKPKGFNEDYVHLIRRNPESYLWFSVGYWYFQQTQWTDSANKRWSFYSGAAELVSI